MRKIPYGEINFESLIKSDAIYVDKTPYIEKLEEELALKKTFYLRPVRFGKSLFTSMLQYYYGIENKEKFEELFGNLYIGKNPTENRNKYYVLKFDFSGMDIEKNADIDLMREIFDRKVINGVEEFSNRYKIKVDCENTLTPSETIGKLFIEFSAQKPQEKIYVIIDEYDNFTNGILKGDADRFLNVVSGEGFVKGFYARIKEAIGVGTVDRFFATGIAPITLDSMTTGFNIATDITRDARFVSMIVFTKKEIQSIIEEVFEEKTVEEKEEIYEEMKQYYDGYRFSEENEERVFNSTLVMYYLKEYKKNGERPKKMLDMNIAANFEKLANLITLKNNPYSKEVLESLMQNKEIFSSITDKFNLAMDLNKKDILSMLFYFGYCTIKENRMGLDVTFKIPNYVMASVYNDYFLWLLKKDGIKINETKVEEAITELALDGKINKLCEIVEEYLSYIGNIAWQKYDEKYVKSYMHAILQLSPVFSTYLEYNVKNNKYIDIAVFKVATMGAKYQAIIEVKYIKKEEAKTKKQKQQKIEEKREEALEQIQEYAQDERLPQDKMKKYICIYVGQKLELLEEIKI